MDFLSLAKKRYTVRSYTSQKVEKEKLETILEAAHVAPTGGNCQPQCLIVCSDTNVAWTRPFDGKQLTDIDASIVTDHMMMQSTELG